MVQLYSLWGHWPLFCWTCQDRCGYMWGICVVIVISGLSMNVEAICRTGSDRQSSLQYSDQVLISCSVQDMQGLCWCSHGLPKIMEYFGQSVSDGETKLFPDGGSWSAYVWVRCRTQSVRPNGAQQPSDEDLMMCSNVVIHDVARWARVNQHCKDMRLSKYQIRVFNMKWD